MGRRRYLPEASSPNSQLQEFALRQAVNAPIQGSSADLIKLAMVKISNQLIKDKLEAKLIIQIHDELIFDLPEKELKEVSQLVKAHMEKSISLKVPVVVNLASGKNWGQLKEV